MMMRLMLVRTTKRRRIMEKKTVNMATRKMAKPNPKKAGKRRKNRHLASFGSKR
jgi:hypothetical protein